MNAAAASPAAPETANAPALEIRGLTKRFPVFQLGPAGLTVPRGSIYAFNVSRSYAPSFRNT